MSSSGVAASADVGVDRTENGGMEIGDRIVHADERLVVADKPSGMPSVRDASAEDESLHALLADHLGERLLVVHRLDRGTSGLIVFARNPDAHRALSQLFESRTVMKRYLAAVLGHLDPPSGIVDRPLRTFGSGRVAVDPRGKPARTTFRVVERLEGADLVDVRPETGRRHQIRVHLYALGHPVLGDTRYGAPRPVGGGPRLMLHAVELTLPGWAEQEGDLVLRREPGEDFGSVIKCWEEPIGT